jgi:hypothetical protein
VDDLHRLPRRLGRQVVPEDLGQEPADDRVEALTGESVAVLL